MLQDPPRPVPEPTDDEIDEIIAEAGGDARQAIRILLHDLAALALDADASVSRGFVRGKLLRIVQR